MVLSGLISYSPWPTYVRIRALSGKRGWLKPLLSLDVARVRHIQVTANQPPCIITLFPGSASALPHSNFGSIVGLPPVSQRFVQGCLSPSYLVSSSFAELPPAL